MNNKNIGKIALTLMDILNQLKIYHWQTTSYARHKASCELINNLTLLTDKIVETLQGSKNTRLYVPSEFNTIIVENQNDTNIVKLLEYFKKWLTDSFPKYISESTDTDILNLRDELLGSVNQTLYLFTFK